VRVSAKLGCFFVALLAACHSPSATSLTETISLTPGAIYPRTIAQGQPHSFRFDLPAGHFFRLAVEQRGLDVVLGLRAPSGRLMLEVDTPIGNKGRETLLAVAQVAGEYVLEVAPLATRQEGAFTLVVQEVRPAKPEDRRRAAMAAALALAEHHLQDGDFEKAVAILRKVLPDFESHGDKSEAAQVQWRLGAALLRMGALRESAETLERSAARFRSLGDRVGEARALNDLGAAWRLLGEPARTLQLYRRALDLYRRAGVQEGEATAIHNIGLVLEGTGDLQGAVEHYEEALDLRRRLGKKSAEAATLQSLGSIYALIGHDEEALDLLRQALALRNTGNDESARISILVALGWAEYLAGQPKSALERYGEALALARREGDRLSEAGTLDRQGTALKTLGRFGDAAAAYARSLELSRAAGSPRNEAHTLANLGWLHLETGEIRRARQDLLRAVDLLVASSDPNGEVYARVGLSQAERLLGDYGSARQQIKLAIQRVEELRTSLHGPASRGHFLATRYDAYEELVGLLMELDRRGPARGHAREALEVAERARARNLLDLMADRSGDADGEEIRQRELQAGIQTLDKRRRALEARDPRDPRLPGIAAALREQSLELDRLTLSRPQTSDFTSLTARQIQDLADHQTLLVIYLLAEPASFAWTVDRQQIVPHLLPGRKKIETLARRVAAALPRSHERAAQGAAERAASDLAEAILAPLGERLAGRPRLVILPDGALNLVPFSALPDPSLKLKAPLLVDHEIVLLPSATVLVQQRKRLAGRPSPPGELAILADPIFSPVDSRLASGRKTVVTADDRGDAALGLGSLARLPFTAEEAQAIARLVPTDKRLVAMGATASRDLVTSGALSRYRRLHFATHGLLHPVLPERSGLVLSLVDAQGRPRDGFLSAPDVAALDLPADLIVLSACRTGLGREIRGEGLVGLTQAFFRAGARSVVVSSWDVRDRATADLMSDFYTGLLVEHLPPAAALRKAQLALRAQPKTASPSFWAGFTLHGDWR